MANRMAGAENSVMEWCLCEKLPRAMLHIPLTRDLRCEVCGLMRKVRRALSSSSSSDEDAIEERQKMLLERRRAEEAYSGPIRVKIGITAKKPHANCLTCGGLPNPRGKVLAGRFGRCPKPKRISKREETSALHDLATAPPPSSPSSSSFQTLPETMWDSPNEDMPNLVAMAHEVFKRPVHQRSRWPTYYSNLFVSDFIPLDSPITDPSGGAISKRRGLGGRPLRTHRSRPLPPLAKVLSEIVSEQEVPPQRAKGGGLIPERDPKCSNSSSQFTPYDQYEGPSEDSLMVNSARFLMQQLSIKSQVDLPSTHLSTFADTEPNTISTPTMPSAPPLADLSVQRVKGHQFRYVRGRRLHLREEVGKAASQTGLSDNSSSSKSSSSSSDSSTQSIPQHTFSYHNELDDQTTDRKQDPDDEGYHEEEGVNAYTTSKVAPTVISIMDKIFWTPIEKVVMTEKEITENSPNHNVECKLDIENDLLNDQANKPKDSAKYSHVLPRQCNNSCTLNGNGYGGSNTTSTSSTEKPKDSSSSIYLTAKECNKIQTCQKCGLYRQLEKLRQTTTTVESIKTISINKIHTNVHKCNHPEPSKEHLNDEQIGELGGGTISSESIQKSTVEKANNNVQFQNICGKCNKRITLTDRSTIITNRNGCGFHSCANPSSTSSEKRRVMIKSPEQLQTKDVKYKDGKTIVPEFKSEISTIEPKDKLRKSQSNENPNISCIKPRETLLTQYKQRNFCGLKEPMKLDKNSSKSLEMEKSINKSPDRLQARDGKGKGNKTIIPEIQSKICTIESKVSLPKTHPNTSRTTICNNLEETLLTEINAGNSCYLKEPTEHYTKNSIQIVRHYCTEMVIPKMVACFKDISATACFTILELVEIKQPNMSIVGIHEFRTPDILLGKELEEISTCLSPTPLAQSPIPKQNQIKDGKRLLPVWPAHPFKYKKNKIKYQEIKLICKANDEQQILDHRKQSNGHYEANSEKSIQNKEDIQMQQQLKEMMIKPIKLLSSDCSGETGEQNGRVEYPKEQELNLNISKTKLKLLTAIDAARESDKEYFTKPEIVTYFRKLPNPLYRKEKLYFVVMHLPAKPRQHQSPIRLRYRNPAAVLLSILASISYWFLYITAYTIIYLSGLLIIAGLIFPQYAWRMLNHILDQYHIERQFKDEL